ncbi:MAG TPA: hypothetical protein VHC90_09455 [Bryobacteraceae bacterium]|nr:hypothetical protein [Bryobacteraceae bacterium]
MKFLQASLASMPGEGTFRLEWIVGLLNSADLASVHLEFHRKAYTSERVKRAEAERLKLLRWIVDQWIESGKDEYGNESPDRRDLSKCGFPVRPGTTEFTPTLAMLAGANLLDAISHWLKRVRPRVKLGPRGEIEIELPEATLSLLRNGNASPNLQRYAIDAAISQFVEFVNTPGSDRLARCHNPDCGRYYLRLRSRKKAIKRGTFCSACLNAGAAARTKINRSIQRDVRIRLAADVWPAKRNMTQWDRRQADSIATKMNKKRTSSDAPVTGKWVSQNRPEIEAEVERRKNAKS